MAVSWQRHQARRSRSSSTTCTSPATTRTCRATWSRCRNLLNFLQRQRDVVLGNDPRRDRAHRRRTSLPTRPVCTATGPGMPQSNSYSYYDPAGRPHTGVVLRLLDRPALRPRGARRPTPATTSTTPPTGPTMPSPPDVNAAPRRGCRYTRAGCNVGEVGTPTPCWRTSPIDIPKVFGAGLARGRGGRPRTRPKATADFVGVAVHCAKRLHAVRELGERQAGRAARRARRLQRLPGAVRPPVRRAAARRGHRPASAGTATR